MRLAVLIIGLAFAVLIFVQGCTVSAFAGDDKGDASMGAGFLLVALGLLLAAAFVLHYPLVAAIILEATAFVGFFTETGGQTSDLPYWGGLALVLAFLSGLSWHREHDRPRSYRDAVAVRQSPTPLPAATITCPRCGKTGLSTAIRFCPNCGLQRTEGVTDG